MKKWVLLSISFAFEKQIKYLKLNYNILSPQQLVEGIEKMKELPKNPLFITFDDGDVSNYTNAFPILKKHGIPAILFIITELINTDKPFWWDEIEYYLGKSVATKKVWDIKKLPNLERQRYLDNLRINGEKPPLKYPQLTTNQLKEMQREGIFIANHSHTHPMFDKCTPEELNKELEKSYTKLHELGFNPELFAYPNGNFSPLAEARLKENGIKYSFLFDHKINKGEINPLRISRLIVNDNTPLWKFKLILSGLHSRILPVTRALGKIRK